MGRLRNEGYVFSFLAHGKSMELGIFITKNEIFSKKFQKTIRFVVIQSNNNF